MTLGTIDINAQVNNSCNNPNSNQSYSATAFVNYGSASNLYNSDKKATVTVGQTTVQLGLFSQSYKAELGFWGQFLLPPTAPLVQASEGNLGDRVEIVWEVDKLSPVVTDVFKIYRNGTFLDEVENDERVYVDYNVVAGEFYTYSVRGVNKAGIGKTGSAVGFVNPNGVITGQVTTVNGNPVSDCIIDMSPTLGSSLQFNGDGSCFADYSEVYDTNTFSATLWVRQDSLNDIAGLLDLGSSIDKNWYIHTLDGISGRGINAGLGGGSGSIDYIFPEESATDWHHVATTYNGKTLLLYVDGELKGSLTDSLIVDSIPVYIGSTSVDQGYYEGLLDEVIIYNRQLSQTEIKRQMNKSISSRVEGLISYWKMDEGTGSTTYDLTDNDNRLYMCGPTWNGQNSPITNSSLTDENGYYILEGINYGSGETFTVRPSKNIYESISLEFNGANEQHAELINFDLTDTTMISTTFNLFNLDADQTIISKGDRFNLSIINGALILNIDGTNFNLGAASLGWHQMIVGFAQNGSSSEISIYLDGQLSQSGSVSTILSDWTQDSQVWVLGANSNPLSMYFTGLIEEFIAYNSILSISEIQESNNIGTDESSPKIYVYFPLNEAQGDSLYNISETAGTGYIENASWANDSKHLSFTEHEFLPSSKFVSLNSTNTSTDQVNFTDLSTIPVSGYVRYKDTECFADSVEILVNGNSATPPIFTDEDGYFVVELEPGANALLSPKYAEHTFSPAFFEVNRAESPVSGILFLDNTLRTVSGQLAGGNCKKSIIPNGGSAKVKLFTLDGCYENEIEITSDNGKYSFDNVPPIECAIAVSFHSLQNIKEYFDIQGGESIDLTFKSDTIDFTYYSEPIVTLSEFGDSDCGLPRLEQFQEYVVNISLHQEYPGGNCPIDTAQLEIYNGFIEDSPVIDTFTVNGPLDYVFPAGPPNIAAPYTKSMQVVATANDESTSVTSDAIILGRRPREVNFTSTTPELPMMVLHDPPGDESYSYFSENTEFCKSVYLDMGIFGDNTAGVNVSVGPSTAFYSGFGVAVKTELEVVANVGISATVSSAATLANTTEICTQLLNEYQTNSDEFLVGDTSDVFIGGALNMLFGVTDILFAEGCEIKLDTGVNVMPGSFESNFFYTEYEIQKNIIPNLLTINDTTSVKMWENILQQNRENKEEAVFVENISFGSGVIIEKATGSRRTKTESHTFDFEVSSTLAGELGFEANGVGLTTFLEATIGFGLTSDSTIVNDTTTLIGYRLSDNDPGDIFTVNIAKDPVHGTPVFKTVAGSSSCPHENNTINRDEVSLTVDKFVANNVRENEAAVFNFDLGNISQSSEQREYIFSLRSSSNVNGAEVKIAGADPLDTEYFVPFGQSFPVSVSVERSPNSYTDTLIFDYFVRCEDDRNIALGIPKSNTPFNRSETIIVNFIEPCSSVDINNPQQDWVQTPADGNLRPISLFDYDVNDDDLDLVRVQYRRSQGDGVWINIAEIPKDSLGTNFENLNWDTDGLSDGLYEIRALAVCVGGLDVGISHVIKGKIERTPPELFGTAEPADGILSRGDEISITFNEPIQCTEIILAAGIGTNIQNNNLGLYDTQTGVLIDFTMSCSNDKLILVPNVPNTFLENKVLRVELDSILDLVGNKSGSLEWEFVVDQNSLNWLDREDVKVVKYEEEFVTVERRIENRGGFNVDWTLEDVPNWCTVFPTAGELSPGDVQIITFEFDENMAFGSQLQTIQLSGPEGDEPMIIDARVVCPPPVWEIRANEWEYAMNITAQLNIEGIISMDEEDVLAAYVEDELRGVGRVEYYPEIDAHLVFLTIYSNTLDPDHIDMRIWDASSCLLFSPAIESFIFQSDDLIGTPLAPQIIHTNNIVLKEVYVNEGWNWLSFNLVLEEPSPDSLLKSIDVPTDGIIKSQTEFAQYADGFGWFGSLSSIGNISAYQLRLNENDTIVYTGNLIDPDTVDIPLNIGWNWIGYLPRSPLTVDSALSSITVLDGDIIKSQTEFAQYVSGYGWIGTLKNLRPDEGYVIKTSVADILNYPNASFAFREKSLIASKRQSLPDGWEVNPFSYEHSMTLTGVVLKENSNPIESGWHLAAFHNGECRGIADAVWVEPLEQYMFFLTMYSNNGGEQMDFKLYNGNEVQDLSESEYFAIDVQLGEIQDPYEFELTATNLNILEDSKSVRLLPNPIQIGQDLIIQFNDLFKGEMNINVYDINGAIVLNSRLTTVEGLANYKLPTSGLTSGMYQLVLSDKNQTINKKFIVVR